MGKKLEKILTNIANWFARNITLSIISQGIMMVMPLMIVGSLFSLLKGMPIEPWQAFLNSTGLYGLFGIPIQFTTDFIAVYITFCVGYQFGQKRKLKKYSTTIGLLSLFSFFVVTPYGDGVIPTQWLGATGMFMGILVSINTGSLFKFILDKNFTIKLPASVPSAVSKQFVAMIPSVVIVTVFLVINWGFGLTQWGNPQDALYAIVRAPLTYLNSSIWGMFTLILLARLFWFFGIHGGMVVGPMAMVLFTEPMIQNQLAFASGETLPNMITGQSIATGALGLPLVIAILLFSKSKSSKAIGVTAIVPGIFGVDEPVMFGLPVILNPIMFIPFVVIMSVVNIFGTYILQLIGFLPYATGLQVNGFMPFFINNFMLYGWKGVVVGFALLAISVISYYPFIRVHDKQKLAEEGVE